MRARKPDGLAELAGRQYGIVARSQLTALGLDRGWVQRSVAEGRLLRLHRGVYAVGHRAPRREARWLAAVLACGPDAVLSHGSAAELWRIGGASGVPEVTLPRRIRPRGIVAHEAALAAADKALNGNIPLTSPARTVVDLAHVLAERDVERLVREAYFRKLVSAATLRDALTRRPSRLIRELLDDLNPTQSRLEDAFLRLCRRFRIPAPEAQLRAGRRRPDFMWREARLVVEVDSWSGHGNPLAFQADRTLSNSVQLSGWTILRFTWADVTRRPAMVAAQVRQALGLS